MNLRHPIVLLALLLITAACALRSTAPRGAFASYKQEIVPMGDENLLLTLSGNFISSYQVIESIENKYKKNDIYIIVHTRSPSANDSAEMKLRLSHAVLIPKAISRVYWGEEVIWQRDELAGGK